MATDVPPPGRPRDAVLDGIRGCAIVLVVLSHLWTIADLDGIRRYAPLDGLFRAGDQAVTVFLVVGGYLVTRTLLRREASAAGPRPWRYLLERLVRIGAQLYPLVLAVLVAHELDAKDRFSDTATYRSLATVSTFTWNWYLQNNASPARSDLGHLWYLSVQEQFYLGLVIVIALFARFRTRLIWAVVGAIFLVTVWRIHVWDTEGWWHSSLRTTTRCDGLLWGVLAALVAERLPSRPSVAGRAFLLSTVAIASVILSSARFRDGSYYTWQGPVLDASLAGWLLAGSQMREAAPTDAAAERVRRWLSWPPLAALGAYSLSIYVWHFPLFWFVALHTSGWDSFPRTVLGVGLLCVVVLVTERLFGRPSRRWLNRLAHEPRRHAQPVSGAGAVSGAVAEERR